MSLEQLISNVSTDLDIRREEVLITLETFVENVGIQPFTMRGFDTVIGEKELEVILKRLEEMDFLTNEISYECYETNSEGVCNRLNDECEFCGESISVNIDHEIEFIYKLVNGVVKLVRNEKLQYDYDKYIIMDYKKNLDALMEQKMEIIPFIGAGLSMPMGLPSWPGLLEKLEGNLTKGHHIENYREYVEEGDYLGALDFLMEKSIFITNDDQLRKEVVKLVESDIKPVDRVRNHNYSDLLKLDSSFYLTTNYDLCISNFISREKEYAVPLTIQEIIDTQELLKGTNQVIHLHGHMKKRDSMVLSKRSYKELYNNSAVRTLLSTVIGARPLLFMGFSFNDDFFKNLYSDLNSFLRTSHYIVLANPNHKDVRRFTEQNIRVIGINVALNSKASIDSDDYILALRTLIQYIVSK